MICGNTADLYGLPRVIRGWAEGAPLEEIGQAASFDLLTGRFEVPDNNPADVTASEWQCMRKDAATVGWPQYQALIETAHAEPKLRRLYPYTNHWALGFAAPDLPYNTPAFVSIEPPRGTGDYTIRQWWNGPALHHVPTPAEAVAIAVGRIPADLLQGSSDAPASNA
ncbi:DUF6193 family natural product biosynthesis protein [Actinomadura gamaensis]